MGSNKISSVVSQVVSNDMCIGCGMCVPACKSDALKIVKNDNGFLVAEQKGPCDGDLTCLNVCPFDPTSVDANNEFNLVPSTDISDDKKQFDKRLGYYYSFYAGYSEDYRPTSSSGGIATYLLYQILDDGLADHVVSVTMGSGKTKYKYSICSSKEDITIQSKTRYYPVSMHEAISMLQNLKGNVALVGVACFIKAVRKAEKFDHLLKGRVTFTIGIICGGVKSEQFTEYLTSKLGLDYSSKQTPEYRVKNPESSAIDYSFASVSESETRSIPMLLVGDMWGTGLFKANACDFCQDVTTELADISLGDAWIEPHKRDGQGTNIVITRSLKAEELIKQGMSTGELKVKTLDKSEILKSQSGSFNHRQDALKIRKVFSVAGFKRSPKFSYRFSTYYPDVFVLQMLRRIVRAKSIKYWTKYKDAEKFDAKLKPYLKLLRLSAKIVNKRRKFFAKSGST